MVSALLERIPQPLEEGGRCLKSHQLRRFLFDVSMANYPFRHCIYLIASFIGSIGRSSPPSLTPQAIVLLSPCTRTHLSDCWWQFMDSTPADNDYRMWLSPSLLQQGIDSV
ncbi:hypothetical protein CDAR_397711 [Caerostris darwini]|uniref:Uncharacterized protein n=1 Tax=Caerostris darwini TaxID=1538125 RepID=A0AAV4TA50_9ARAC|nr:hypothetical protein CDAR_397711 [Caerostris darwini]